MVEQQKCISNRCSRPVATGYKQCAVCKQNSKKSNKRYYKNAKNAGRCVICNQNPQDDDVVRCAACRKAHNQRQRDRYAKRMGK